MSDPLYITYAWVDNEEGDFDYLVQELRKVGVPTLYDKIALIPGRRLWAQIADRISSDPLSGWASLITRNSLASPPCQEELSYALLRTLETKGKEFPLIGLLHSVSVRDIPSALKVRLCVNLADPDWTEQVRAAVTGTPPRRTLECQEQYVLKKHESYLGRPGHVAVEIRPRFGQVTSWRIAFPSNGPQPVEWGTGPANGGCIGLARFDAVEGDYHDTDRGPMKFVGASNILTASISAYVIFHRELPETLFFGVAEKGFGAKVAWNIIL